MAVEKLDLKQGLGRVSQMVTENLLFISPGQVAAAWAGAITGLPFWIGGVLLGWAVWRGIDLSSWASPLKEPLALAAGVAAACLIFLIAIGETAYASAAYRACLYAWARKVESGRSTGDPSALEPPQPLAACLVGLEKPQCTRIPEFERDLRLRMILCAVK